MEGEVIQSISPPARGNLRYTLRCRTCGLDWKCPRCGDNYTYACGGGFMCDRVEMNPSYVVHCVSRARCCGPFVVTGRYGARILFDDYRR